MFEPKAFVFYCSFTLINSEKAVLTQNVCRPNRGLPRIGKAKKVKFEESFLFSLLQPIIFGLPEIEERKAWSI